MWIGPGAVNCGAVNTHAFNARAPNYAWRKGTSVASVTTAAAVVVRRRVASAIGAVAATPLTTPIVKRLAKHGANSALSEIAAVFVNKRAGFKATQPCVLIAEARSVRGRVARATSAPVTSTEALVKKREEVGGELVAAGSAIPTLFIRKRAALGGPSDDSYSAAEAEMSKRARFQAAVAASAAAPAPVVTKLVRLAGQALSGVTLLAPVHRLATLVAAVIATALESAARMTVIIAGQLVGSVQVAAAAVAAMAKRAVLGASEPSAVTSTPVVAIAKRSALDAAVTAAVAAMEAQVAKRQALEGGVTAALATDSLMSKRAALLSGETSEGVGQGRAALGYVLRGSFEAYSSALARDVALGYVLRGSFEAYSSALARDVALIQVGGAGPVWPARERRSVWVLVARPTTWIVAYRKKRVGRAAAAVGPAPSIFVQMPLRERTSSAFNVGPVLGAVVGG